MFKDNNRLYFYWKLGKSVFKNQYYYDNIIKKVSDFYSYKYGLTFAFSEKNIKNMKLFYLCFPCFYDDMNRINWNHYLKLIDIIDSEKRNFYFKISIYFKFSYNDLLYLIDSCLYERI